MPRISQQEARAFSQKFNRDNRALKSAEHGGPVEPRHYATGGFAAGNAGVPDAGTDLNATQAAYYEKHPTYPDYTYPDDYEEDTRIRAKAALANRTRGGGREETYLGEAYLTDRDVDWYMNKLDAQQMVNFKLFVENSVPRGTPWAKDYFEKFVPGWYQSKIDIVNEKLDIVQRFIEMTIQGPQSIEDMFLLYQLYHGEIELPTNFQQLIHPDSQQVFEDDYVTGFLNPKRWVTDNKRVAWRNQKYLANFAIPGIDTKGLAAGIGGINMDNNAVAGDAAIANQRGWPAFFRGQDPIASVKRNPLISANAVAYANDANIPRFLASRGVPARAAPDYAARDANLKIN